MFINCLIDEFVKPGERLIGVGMLANTSPINILQDFCIEGGIITDLSFIVWKEYFESYLTLHL